MSRTIVLHHVRRELDAVVVDVVVTGADGEALEVQPSDLRACFTDPDLAERAFELRRAGRDVEVVFEVDDDDDLGVIRSRLRDVVAKGLLVLGGD